MIFDRSGQDIADVMIASAGQLYPGKCLAVYLPITEQEWLTGQPVLPAVLLSAIRSSDAMITCLTNADNYTRCRIRLLDAARAAHLKIVHMPGVDKRMFLRGIADLDFRNIHTSASELQALLQRTTHVTIATTDNNGEHHSLSLNIASRQAHVCGGVAVDGEIMNIPTGETYIAPNERLSTGSIVVNGSTDRLVFSPDDNIVLVFNNGLLDIDRSQFSDSATALQLSEELREEHARNPDSMYLCELGIGVNEAVDRLSGDEILDEKAAGTIHIALGGNSPFGGDLDGTYHRDLILIPDSFVCDGVKIPLHPPPRTWRQ